MRIPDDHHLRSVFLKARREIVNHTRDEDGTLTHHALMECCLTYLESILKGKNKGDHYFCQQLSSHLNFSLTERLSSSQNIQNLSEALKDFIEYPSVIASLNELEPEKCRENERRMNSKFSDTYSEKKRHGYFFTPLKVAYFITQTALDICLNSKPQKTKIEILDPSVGGGIFLDTAISVLMNRNPTNEKIRYTLHGIENDAYSLKMARRALSLKSKELRNIKIKLLEGDFLLDKLKHPEDGYDIIIGNPPYVSYYSRGAQSDELTKSILKEKYGSKAGGSLNTFLHFIVRGIELLSEDGILGFIVPDKLLWNRRYHRIRQFILDNAPPIRILTAGEGVFKGANVGNAIILLEKTKSAKSCEIADISFKQGSSDFEIKNIQLINIGAFRDQPESRFVIKNPLLSKIEKDSIPLKKLAHIKDGINPAFKEFREKIISRTKKGPEYRPVIEGQDIAPFRIKKRELYINYDPTLVTRELKRRGVSLRQPWIFDSERKLVNRQTSDKLIFALDEEKLCDLNSVHNTILHDEIDPLLLDFILGLMNSRLMNYYYQKTSSETGKSFPQVHIADLEELPIKIPSNQKLNSLIKIIRQISKSDGDRYKLLENLDNDIFEIYEINEIEREEIIKFTGKEWRI